MLSDLYVLSWSFFLVFLAFSTTQNLESTLFPGPEGTASLGTIYIVLCVSSFYAPQILKAVGVKRCIVAGLSSYVMFVAANLYVSWGTLIPSAILLGCGAGILWSAHGVYLSALAPTKQLAVRASGIFFGIYQFSQMAGNLIAFVVLSYGEHDTSGFASDSPHVSKVTIRILFGLFTLSALTGATLSNFLSKVPEPLQDLSVNPVHSNESSTTASLLDAGNGSSADSEEGVGTGEPGGAQPSEAEEISMLTVLFRDLRLLSLVCLFFYSGVEAAFVWSEFTALVVNPVLGQAKVPLIMTFFGVANSLCSWLLSKLGSLDKLATVRYLSAGCLLQVAVTACILFFFEPERLEDSPLRWPTLILAAICLGVADAVLNTLITSLLASMYDPGSHSVKLAFAHFKLWQSLSIAVAFFVSAYVSLDAKCIVTIIFGFLALAGMWSVRT